MPYGKGVPGVTTILSRFKESGALIGWAYKTGVSEGLKEGLGEGIAARSVYKAATEEASDIGSVVHDMVEAHLYGEDPLQKLVDLQKLGRDRDAYVKMEQKAELAFGSYLAWERTTRFEITETETPYVSKVYGYGGTLDAVGHLGGELVLLDWKTSNAVYTDYLLQVAAYAILYEENHPQKTIKACHLARFSKNSGNFTHHAFRSLEVPKRMFLLLREAYDLDTELKEMLR